MGQQEGGKPVSGAQLAPGPLMSGQAMVLPRSVRLGNVAWVCVPGGPVGRVGQEGFTGASGLLQEDLSCFATLPFLWALGRLRLDPDSSSGHIASRASFWKAGMWLCYALEPGNLGRWGQRLVRGESGASGS